MRLSEIKLQNLSGGINTHDPEYSVEDNQSPKMLNLWYKDKALCKRDGQTLAVTLADAYRISGEFNGYRALHAGESMYRWDGRSALENKGVLDASGGVYPTDPTSGDYYVVSVDGTIEGTAYVADDWALYDGSGWYNTLCEIKTGLEDSAGTFVEFGDKLYYLDGVEIWQISSTFAVSAVDPYEPIVLINCLPDLTDSADNESYNLIGGGFTVHYHGDGASTEYALPKISGQDLDDTLVTAVVDGVDKAETTDFTIVRATGVVTFTTEPGEGINNVWITAYQTVSGDKDKIVKCTVALPFGGESSGVDGGARVFVMGNSDNPLNYWRSDLGLNLSFGMTYFPDTGEELLGQNSEPIQTAAKMEGEMVIFKTNSIFAVGYAFDGENVFHPVRECHSSIGCDMPGSVQLVDNRLVFCNTKNGVHTLISSSNRLENTVKPLSANINTQLLSESNLASASSVDFERYYWLCVNDKVFLWDYEQTPYTNYADYEQAQRRLAWYMFDGIEANDFCIDGSLFYASGSGIVNFTRNKNDFGQAFEAYFLSKAFDLNSPNMKKTFMELYPSFRSDGDVKATVTVGNEKMDSYKSREIDIRSFDWDDFSWATFTWNTIKFTKTFLMKLRMKMVSYLQVKVESNDINRSFGLTGLRVTYYNNGKVKR